MWQAHASCLGETKLKDLNILLHNQLKQNPNFSRSPFDIMNSLEIIIPQELLYNNKGRGGKGGGQSYNNHGSVVQGGHAPADVGVHS